tara:strand:+ start:308 stop:691 length:384 start_codon:yes stop_codon:yes gene_type:complete
MSTLKADTIQSTSGGAATLTKQHAAKAWINFNQTSTQAIRDSFNISSITDAATGQTSPIAFTNSMSDANFSPTHFNNANTGNNHTAFGNNYAGGCGGLATGSFGTSSYNTGYVDAELNYNSINGDLA